MNQTAFDASTFHPVIPYRHELKYQIDYASYLALRQRLRPILKSDPHANQNGRYKISSIYFDNADDKALREKINGNSKRAKFRIRYYNDDLSYLTLEKKIKDRYLCLKLDAEITSEECARLLNGDKHWMAENASDLVRELSVRMTTDGLRPRVLVSYQREPYIFAAGNVRITFDSDIRTSLYRSDFLNPAALDIGACDTPETMIMEVKYDNFLPEIIAHLIQSETTRQNAFSKYAICRRFG